MAIRYAVASGNWSDNANVWSDTDGGAPGAFVPVDGDEVVISAGVNVLMDVDQSSWTGLLDVTIRGGATPGMLYWKNGTDGYLKVRTGYDIAGTLDTNRGRILVNSDGVWGNDTPLQSTNKAVIELAGTANIEMQYLDVQFYCSHPTTKSIRVYNTRQTVTSVDPSTDTLTVPGHGFSSGSRVQLLSSGSLPAGLEEGVTYYIRNVTTDTFKLAGYNNDSCIVDITDAGSGTIEVFSGISSGATTLNTVDDVTGDLWAVGDRVSVVDLIGFGSYDQQRTTIAGLTSNTITLANALDSGIGALSEVVLVQRNVSILRSVSNSDMIQYSSSTHTGHVWNCEITNLNAGLHNTAIYSGYGWSFNGTMSGWYYGARYARQCTIEGIFASVTSGLYSPEDSTINGTFAGCSTAVNAPRACSIGGTMKGCSTSVYNASGCSITSTIKQGNSGVSGGTSNKFTGTIINCSYAINGGTLLHANGTYKCNQYVFYNSNDTNLGSGNAQNNYATAYQGFHRLYKLTSSRCYRDIYSPGRCIGSQLELLSSTPVTPRGIVYKGQGFRPPILQLFDSVSGGSTQWGSFSAWNEGGTMESAAYDESVHGDLQASGWDLPDPDWIITANFSTSSLSLGEQACPLFAIFPILATEGITVEFEMNVKLGTLTDWDELPRIQIIDTNEEWMSTNELLAEAVSSAISGWQHLTVSYTIPDNHYRQLAVRVYGTRTVRNGSFQWCWRQKASSGSVVVVHPPLRPEIYA